MGFEPSLHLVSGLATTALADRAMAILLEIMWSFVLLFITAIKCLKNQILGKIKLPGFPMLGSHCATVITLLNTILDNFNVLGLSYPVQLIAFMFFLRKCKSWILQGMSKCVTRLSVLRCMQKIACGFDKKKSNPCLEGRIRENVKRFLYAWQTCPCRPNCICERKITIQWHIGIKFPVSMHLHSYMI